MKKNIIQVFLLSMALTLFTACGTDQKANPPSVGPYSFTNATTPLKIVQSVDVNGTMVGSTFAIKVQLLEFGLAKSAESVQMKPFDYHYGFVTNTVVTTDINGYATFIYNLPDNYSKIKGKSITIQAVFLDPNQIINQAANTVPVKRNVLLTQEFVINFL